MSTLVIPQGYKAPLPNYELQRAIAFIKESFQTNLSNALNLRRVSAPLFVASIYKNMRAPQGKENKDKERKFFV